MTVLSPLPLVAPFPATPAASEAVAGEPPSPLADFLAALQSLEEAIEPTAVAPASGSATSASPGPARAKFPAAPLKSRDAAPPDIGAPVTVPVPSLPGAAVPVVFATPENPPEANPTADAIAPAESATETTAAPAMPAAIALPPGDGNFAQHTQPAVLEPPPDSAPPPFADAMPSPLPNPSGVAEEAVPRVPGAQPAAKTDARAVVTIRPAAREAEFLKQLASCETKPATLVPEPTPEIEPPPAVPAAPVHASATVPGGSPAVETPSAPAPLPPPSRHEAVGPPRMQLAFGARLAAAVAGQPVKAVAHTAATASKPGQQQNSPPQQNTPAGTRSPKQSRADEATPEPARSRSLRAPDEAAGAPDSPPAAEQPARPDGMIAPASPGREDRNLAPPEQTAAETGPPRPAAPAAPPAAPKPAAVARDIRLDVATPDRKVEVRLVERAGGVELAVRTPDERLAGALREHLPLLSSRLEQSGFHADQWHATEAAGGSRRLEVAATSEPSGQTSEDRSGGGREQPDREGRRPAPREERNQAQKKGTEFEWLMQSLR